MWKKLMISAGLATALNACAYVDEYEAHVHDWEPVYCYKSLAGTQCYKEPKHSDERRLVNYYGPHPSRYDAPDPRPPVNVQAPERSTTGSRTRSRSRARCPRVTSPIARG